MKTIRLNDGVKIVRFPDSQTHAIVDVAAETSVRLVWPVRSNDDLVQLMQASEALDAVRVDKRELAIPYLMGARSDRRMEENGSIDLRVVANCINACRFDRVRIFDVHSEIALALIRGAENIDARALVQEYGHPESVLICPDAGAAKKVGDYARWNPCFVETVFCAKERELSTGRLSLRVLEPARCFARRCAIVDDLCDGGATFLAIAEQIMPLSLTLIVSHGIFSKGLEALSEKFDRIITSDSYYAGPAEGRLTVVPLNL